MRACLGSVARRARAGLRFECDANGAIQGLRGTPPGQFAIRFNRTATGTRSRSCSCSCASSLDRPSGIAPTVFGDRCALGPSLSRGKSSAYRRSCKRAAHLRRVCSTRMLGSSRRGDRSGLSCWTGRGDDHRCEFYSGESFRRPFWFTWIKPRVSPAKSRSRSPCRPKKRQNRT